MHNKSERMKYTMRKFKVNVNGNLYEVEVEEIGGASAPTTPVAAPVQSAPAAQPVSAAPTTVPAGATSVEAPMPGRIVSVKVNAGDSVEAGDVVCVLEAMKMENEIMAPCSGKIVAVSVSGGDTVNTGDVLVSIG